MHKPTSHTWKTTTKCKSGGLCVGIKHYIVPYVSTSGSGGGTRRPLPPKRPRTYHFIPQMLNFLTFLRSRFILNKIVMEIWQKNMLKKWLILQPSEKLQPPPPHQGQILNQPVVSMIETNNKIIVTLLCSFLYHVNCKGDVLLFVIYSPPENSKYALEDPFVLCKSYRHMCSLGDVNYRIRNLQAYIEPDLWNIFRNSIKWTVLRLKCRCLTFWHNTHL